MCKNVQSTLLKAKVFFMVRIGASVGLEPVSSTVAYIAVDNFSSTKYALDQLLVIKLYILAVLLFKRQAD